MSIDYGMGTVNIDKATGIRYGVIPAGDVCQAWSDSSEADYGEPTCPKCGNPAVDMNGEPTALDSESDGAISELREGYEREPGCCADYCCDDCEITFDLSTCDGEPIAWTLDDGEYKAEQHGGGHDIFVTKSPYYSRGPFCSPCAPGAVYLRDGSEDGQAKAYCFGHDWFDEGKAPYPVYRVSDDTLVTE